MEGATLNVGRVQSPTLALIVKREEAVRGFVSEPFYTPEINCAGFTASGEKHKEYADADVIRAAADGWDALVLSVEKCRRILGRNRLLKIIASIWTGRSSLSACVNIGW